MSDLLLRIRLTLRALLRRPGYAIAAVLTLSLGIGASTAIFSLLYGSLLRPLPYPEPDELIRVHNAYLESGGGGPFATPNHVQLATENRTLDELVGYSFRSLNVAAESAPERIRGVAVTANFFDGLGVGPVLGRGFEEGEDRESAARVVVLDHRVWTDRFAGRPDVLGEQLRLNGEAHTVVGVLPASFWFPGDPQVVVPFSWGEDDLADGNRGSRWLSAFGRLAPGVAEPAARDDMGAITDRIARAFPGNNEGWTVVTMPFQEHAIGRSRTSLLLLTGAVVMVLLIGCVNVANLMLVRSERRQREIAVRAALGAGRRRLTAGFVGESLALAGAGALGGLALAWGGTRALLGLYGDALPRAEQVGMNVPVLAFAIGAALLAGLLIGLVPAMRLDVGRLYHALRHGGHASTAAGSPMQRALVGIQVALAVVLVAGAGLLMNSFWHLNRVETGVNPENTLVFQVELPAGSYESPASREQFFQRAIDEIAGIPAVRHVGITGRTPLQGGSNITSLASPDDPELEARFVETRRVNADFFAAAGIPLVSGRLFDESEERAGAGIVVISDVLAATLFPRGDGLGKFLFATDSTPGYEVVGVVGSVREFGVTRDKRPAVYWPFPGSFAPYSMVFLVRTAGEPMATLPQVRQTMAGLDPTLPLFAVRTMEDVVIETVGDRWFATALFAAFGIIALGLAALGIFGVLAYLVEQRTREIGIRMALGATSRTVTRLVVREALRMTLTGLAIGLVTAVFASRLLADLLFEVEPADPLTLLAVTAVAAATGALAGYMPARRAARLQPMLALREE